MFVKVGTQLLAVGMASVVLLYAAGCSGSPANTSTNTNAGTSGAKTEPEKKLSNQDKLVGTWFPVKDPTTEIVFGEAGKLVITNDKSKDPVEGTYTVVGDKLTLELKGKGSQTTKIKQLTETALVLEREQSSIRASRKGDTQKETTEVVSDEFKKDVSGSDRAKAKADQTAASNSPDAALQNIGIAYSLYQKDFGAAPTQADDFAPYVDNDPRALKPLKAGDIVFIYNVKPEDMKDGPAKTVLAYTKDTPTQGGTVLLGDGKVVKMTAEDFKKASLAKPKDK